MLKELKVGLVPKVVKVVSYPEVIEDIYQIFNQKGEVVKIETQKFYRVVVEYKGAYFYFKYPNNGLKLEKDQIIKIQKIFNKTKIEVLSYGRK